MDIDMRRGFTLIELSIVLVIISLVVGGVMVGRDLIEASIRRQAITQIEKFNIATLAFKIKYNCLPGDCTLTQANSFGLSSNHPRTSSAQNGNNNGTICDGSTVSTLTSPTSINAARFECLNYWWQLAQSNMIDWSTADTSSECSGGFWVPGLHTPSSPFNTNPTSSNCGGWIIIPTYGMAYGSNSFGNPNHVLALHASSGASVNPTSGIEIGSSGVYHSNTATLTPSQAWFLDTKMDDGLPNSGKVRAMGWFRDTTPVVQYGIKMPYRGNAGLSVCMVDSVTPNIYNVTSNVKSCNLSFEAMF